MTIVKTKLDFVNIGWHYNLIQKKLFPIWSVQKPTCHFNLTM